MDTIDNKRTVNLEIGQLRPERVMLLTNFIVAVQTANAQLERETRTAGALPPHTVAESYMLADALGIYFGELA